MFLRRSTWSTALLAILIAGCIPQGQPAPTATPAAAVQPSPTSGSKVAQMATQAPTPQVATLAPGVTPTVAPTLTALSATGYPAPMLTTPSTSAAYPYPPAGQGQTPQGALPQNPSGAASSAFKDCARTPGLVGCSPQAAALAGRLAFVDPTAGRVVALDLQTGQGWQAPLQPAWLDWSPGAQKLLAYGEQNYAVYTAQGQPVPLNNTAGVTAGAPQPTWLADGTLSLTGAVKSADGMLAWLEYKPDMTWLLHLKLAQGAESTLPLEAQPTDRLYQMVGWVPGAQKLLVQRYFASNSAMLVGGDVLLVDIASRAVQPLNVTAPLNTGADFSWSPASGGPLAFLASGGPVMMARRLALFDPKTAALRYPLPDGVDVTGLAWRPDGARLTFTAAPGENASAEAKKIVPGAGIYQLDLASGAVETVLADPSGAADGWPHWTADGQTLLYGRAITPASGSPTAQVRARQGQRDWTLVDGLPGPQDMLGAGGWRSVVAYGQ